MHFYYQYHYILILVCFFSKKVLPRGGPLEITEGGRGGGENFSVHECFFSSLVCMNFFFLALHEFFFQSLLAGNFFSDKFPLYNFFGGVGGGQNCLEIAYSPTDLPT